MLQKLLLNFILKKLLIFSLAAIFIALFLQTSFAQVQNDYRTINSGDWTDPAIWQRYNTDTTGGHTVGWKNAGTYPDISWNVITISLNNTVSLNVNLNLDQLVIAGTLTLDGGAPLKITNGALHDLTLIGTISGANNITIDTGATVDFQGGTISGIGGFNISSGATLFISSSSITLNRTLTNNGTISWTNGSIQGSGSINNNSVFNSTTNFGGSCNVSFINNGTLNKNSNNQNLFFGSFQNPGTLNIQSGGIMITQNSGTAAINGIITVASAGTLQFGNGVFVTYNVNASVSGAGTIVSNTSVINFTNTCSYNISGTTTAFSGTMTFAPGMTLTNIGNITPAGGNITLPSGLTVGAYGSALRISAGGAFTANTGTSFHFQKISLIGTLSGSDSLFATDSISFSSGLMNGTGPIKLEAGGQAVIFNNGITSDKTFINNGTTNWIHQNISGSGTIYNNSVFNMSNTANSCSNLIINSGTLNKSSSFVSTFYSGLVNTSTGVLNLTGASLNVWGSSTYSISGSINVASGTTFQFGNSSSGTFNISGSITGAGSFYGHSANVNFLPGSVYNIGGTTGTYSGNVNFNSGMTLTNIGSLSIGGGTINLQPGLIVSSIGSSLNLSGGGTINFNSGQKFQFSTILAAGTIAGSDTVSLSGNMVLGTGGLSGTGPFNMLSGSVLDINLNGVTITKTINNAGTINWSAGQITGTSVINNNNIINISVSINSTINSLINNAGTINKTLSSVPFMAGGCVNSGTLNVTAGGLIITPAAGTFNSSGNYNISSGASLSFGNGSGNAIHNINGNVSGAGNVTLTANTVNLNPSSTYNISGTTTVSFGSANFNAGMTLTNLGSFVSTGGTANFLSGLNITSYGSTLNIGVNGVVNFNTGKSYTFNGFDAAGTIAGSDTVFVNNSFNWTNGVISNVIVLKPTVTTTLSTATGVTVNGRLINNGTMNWTSSGFNGNGMFINNNIFNINTTSTHSMTSPMTNNGTVNKNSSNTTSLGNTFINNGIFNINAGIIAAPGGLNYGTINLTNNTTLSINGAFTSWGTMNIPANSFINGNSLFTCNSATFVNNGNISVNMQFDSITAVSGTGVFNNVATFLNGSNVSLTSNTQFRNIIVNSGGIFTIDGYKLFVNGTATTIVNNGTFNTNNSTIEYNGSSAQGISNTNIVYKNLTINNPAGTNLVSGVLTVNDTLKVIAGTFSISGNTVALGTTGYLSELNGAVVTGTTGLISVARTLNSPQGVNVAGLGATITSDANLGVTNISRGFTAYTINGSGSVKRYYNISPANNTGLNATLTYHYETSELNGLNENLLSLYRSTNSGTNWSTIGGSKDAANNTITYSGINAFSYWTAAVNPLASSIDITAIVDAMYNTSSNTLNKKDTVTVYLRNSFDPYTILDSAKILIDTVSFTGTAFFNATPSGTYYISLKFRNALETWSKSGGESYTAGTSMSYDFTTAQSKAFGNTTVLKNGKYCVISGDVNQDGFVNGNDFTSLSQQYGLTGYLRPDLNGDNVVNGNDFTSFSAGYGKQAMRP